MIHSPRRTPGFIALAVGFLLLMMGTPRLLAGLELFSHDTAMRLLARDAPQVSNETLVQIAHDYETANSWAASADIDGEIARLRYQLAYRLGIDTEAGYRELQASLLASTQAVYASPGLPYAWTYRALALDALEGMTAKTLASLRMSIVTAPYQPQLFAARLSLGLSAWTSIDEETRQLLAEQIFAAARYNPKALAQAIKTPSQYRLVREILVAEPTLLLALDQAR